jgi:adenylate cyclase
LQLHEIGGIGEPFNLSLPSRSQALHPLPQPLPIRFTVLEEKFVGRTVYEGCLTALSDVEASIQSPLTLALLSNVRITVAATSRDHPAGDIYGKVVGAVQDVPGDTRIRFTSVTPELKLWATTLSSR